MRDPRITRNQQRTKPYELSGIEEEQRADRPAPKYAVDYRVRVRKHHAPPSERQVVCAGQSHALSRIVARLKSKSPGILVVRVEELVVLLAIVVIGGEEEKPST